MELASQGAQLKPISFWHSTALFTIPGIIFCFLYLYLFEFLLDKGFTHGDTMVAVNIIGLPGLLALALYLYRREGNVFQWQAFKRRMRIKPMDKKTWGFTLIAVIINIGGYLGFFVITVELINGRISLPTWAIQPTDTGPVVGMYSLIVIHFLLLLLNVFSEEILWRGYILPRQELQHGKRAWWIHGLQWTWFHLIFKPWELLMLLPGCLAISWVCSKTKNTTPGLIVHLALNGLGVIMVSLAVFGIIG